MGKASILNLKRHLDILMSRRLIFSDDEMRSNIKYLNNVQVTPTPRHILANWLLETLGVPLVQPRFMSLTPVQSLTNMTLKSQLQTMDFINFQVIINSQIKIYLELSTVPPN